MNISSLPHSRNRFRLRTAGILTALALLVGGAASAQSASAYQPFSETTYNPCNHVVVVSAGLYPAPYSWEHWKFGFEVKKEGQWSRFIGWNELTPKYVSWPNIFTGYASGFAIEVTATDPSKPLVPESVYAWFESAYGSYWHGYLTIKTLSCNSQLSGYNQAVTAGNAYNLTGTNLAVSNMYWG
jgi:hypothetical protein